MFKKQITQAETRMTASREFIEGDQVTVRDYRPNHSDGNQQSYSVRQAPTHTVWRFVREHHGEDMQTKWSQNPQTVGGAMATEQK